MKIRLVTRNRSDTASFAPDTKTYSGLPDHVGRQIGQEITRMLERAREIGDLDEYDPFITIDIPSVQL